MLYEPRDAPPLPGHRFALRLALHAGAAVLLGVASLGAGMWGYAAFEGLGWRDAFLEAAMLLGGMGPVHAPATPTGKIFAGLYALYAGVVFLVAAGIIFAPVVHRLLHLFHWDDKDR